MEKMASKGCGSRASLVIQLPMMNFHKGCTVIWMSTHGVIYSNQNWTGHDTYCYFKNEFLFLENLQVFKKNNKIIRPKRVIILCSFIDKYTHNFMFYVIVLNLFIYCINLFTLLNFTFRILTVIFCFMYGCVDNFQ